MYEIFLYLVFTPLIGVILSLLIYPFARRLIKWVGILSILGSAIFSVWLIFLSQASDWSTISIHVDDYIRLVGLPSPELIITTDALGIFMASIASVLGLLIAIFSTEYMKGDLHEGKYWIFLQLFVLGMDLLVLAGDFILLFVGWEIVGLCSFALIAHYFYKDGKNGKKAALAGIKAFVFTHIADLGLLFSIILIFTQTHSLLFTDISSASIKDSLLIILSVSLFISAIGKSALFPFTPWLSSPRRVDVDAMQGPTTVSALIHAATMVKAGVYLVSRLYLLFTISSENVFWILVLIPSITAIATAFSALVSIDIKRILAYSTVSQLSYMFMGLALAISSTGNHSGDAFLASQYHLLSHAIFKSLLFLTAGYLIHSYHSRDITDLSGTASWKTDKVAFVGIVFGGLSLSGIFPFMGFFSKESIITISHEISGIYAEIIYWIALLTAVITALYCSKLFYYLVIVDMTSEEKPHDSPAMQIIILLLSALVLFGGLMNLFLPDFFSEYGAMELKIDWLESSIVTVILVLVIIAGIRIFGAEGIITSITSNILIRFLSEIAREGFYLESMWNAGWLFILRIARYLRYIHTGDLNITMFLISLMSIFMTAVIVGG